LPDSFAPSLSRYLNYEELMDEEEDEYVLEDRIEDANKTWVASLGNKQKGLLPWTDGEMELKRQMGLQRKAGQTIGGDFFLRHLTTLRLYQTGIETIDPAFQDLTHLTELTLSGNSIQVLENLPPNLETLNAHTNRIASVGELSHLQKLYHLGLGFNILESIESLDQDLPHLRSLDVGYNKLGAAGRDQALDVCATFPNLKNLILAGNPFSMAPYYRLDAIQRLTDPLNETAPGLKWLDDVTISRQELATARDMKRIPEERASPLVWSLSCLQLDNLDRLKEELPEEEAIIMATPCAYGPWRADWVDPSPYVPPAEPEEGWGEEGPPPVPEPPPVPPAPVVSHAFYIEIDALGHRVKSRPYPVGEESPEPSFQPLPPEVPPPPLEEGEEQPPDPPAQGEEGYVAPDPLCITLKDWVPSMEARDEARGKGVEAHIVRVTTFSHQEHAAFYQAKAVPEEATEEETALIRAIPGDTTVEALVRVASGELSGLMEGLMEFPVEARSFSGAVVETARLENWAIMAENMAQINLGLLPAGQTMKLKVSIGHDWAPPEPEPAAPEEGEAEAGA